MDQLGGKPKTGLLHRFLAAFRRVFGRKGRKMDAQTELRDSSPQRLHTPVDDLFLMAEQLGISPLEILQDLLTVGDLEKLGRALQVEQEKVRLSLARAMQRMEEIAGQMDAIRQVLNPVTDPENDR